MEEKLTEKNNSTETTTVTTPRKRTTRKKATEKEWTIVTALCEVLAKAHDSELKPKFWKSADAPLTYLEEKLSLNKIQIVVLSMFIEVGHSLSYRNMATYLGTSRLKMLEYMPDVEDLFSKRWLRRSCPDGENEGFRLADGVANALCKNKVFVPESISNLSEEKFYARIDHHFFRALRIFDANVEDEKEQLKELIEANPQIEAVRLVARQPLIVQIIFLLIVDNYIEFNNTNSEGIDEDCIDKISSPFDDPFISIDMSIGEHYLIKSHLVEHKCNTDGIADEERFTLTKRAKTILFAGKAYLLRKHSRIVKANTALTSYKTIKKKELFYNASEASQIERLQTLLTKKQLPLMQKRLQEMNMRKGFAILFYGAPGCGKTETVLQIARETKRDIMLVDIASMRDKYVGESEKNIKMVFDQYREICKDRKGNIPILVFNEADAIIGKRSNNAESSADKMNNTMMNILLQEMEIFEGILIATTNLTSNMDPAFERRFLFKTEFKKPSIDVKTKIWTSMIDGLTEHEARTLASRYDFSGGEIENVARKHAIEYILTGTKSSIDKLDRYCKEEKIASKANVMPIAGFRG